MHAGNDARRVSESRLSSAVARGWRAADTVYASGSKLYVDDWSNERLDRNSKEAADISTTSCGRLERR